MLTTIRNILETTSPFDLCPKSNLRISLESVWERYFEQKGSYRKGISLFDLGSIVSTQLQLIVIEPGSLETQLCSRSNHRIYVAWSVKGSSAAWDARSCALTHLNPTPTWYQRSSILYGMAVR